MSLPQSGHLNMAAVPNVYVKYLRVQFSVFAIYIAKFLIAC